MAACARLVIICGLPGSGKTTLARRLEDGLPAVRFCPDEWMEAMSFDLYDELTRDRIEQLQWRLAQQTLLCGANAIIEWGTWGQSERDRLRYGARKIGAAVELHYLTASPAVLLERLQERGREDPPITKEMLSGYLEVFDEPTNEELALFDVPLIQTLG